MELDTLMRRREAASRAASASRVTTPDMLRPREPPPSSQPARRPLPRGIPTLLDEYDRRRVVPDVSRFRQALLNLCLGVSMVMAAGRGSVRPAIFYKRTPRNTGAFALPFPTKKHQKTGVFSLPFPSKRCLAESHD
jgi:hypothetical protein